MVLIMEIITGIISAYPVEADLCLFNAHADRK